MRVLKVFLSISVCDIILRDVSCPKITFNFVHFIFFKHQFSLKNTQKYIYHLYNSYELLCACEMKEQQRQTKQQQKKFK